MTGILFLIFSGPVAQGDANLWSFQNWKIEDGLPDNNVSGILQMPDGAILIATYGGLVRFDGVRMTQPEATPGNGNGRGSLVRTMLVSRSGQLWLATGQGRIVHRSGNRSEVFTPPHGANSFPVHLCEDAEGRIWVSYAEGEVVCIANGVAEPQGETQGLPGGAVAKFTVDRDGELWGVAGEALHRYQNGRFQKTADLTASPNWRRTTCIATAADGGLWLSSGLQIFQKDRDKPLIRVASIPEKADNTSVSRLFEDRSGTLWICLYDGNVYCLHEGRLSRAGGAMHEITAIADDQEGNIWLGASEGGLWRIRPRVLESLAGADPLVLEAMCSTAQDQAGDIWITGTNGFLYKRESGKWRHLSTNSGWTPAEARTVVANKKGGVWIGTKDEGVFESTAEGGFRPLPFPSAPPWGNIRAMLAAEDSSLWTAINTDLWHLEGNTWTLYSSNLTEGYIQTLTQDAEGVVWAGTSEGQLLAIVDGELRDCTPPGFGDAAVRGLLATPDGALWIGRATEGLLRITGPKDQRPQIVGPDQGLDRSSISHLILDDQGRLWGGSSQGIFSVSLHELTAAAAGASTRVQLAAYGRDEGLPSLQSARGYWPNTLRDQEGKLWFNMRTGTVLAHPGAAGNNPVPPPVQIQSARVDDKPVPVSDQTSLVLPPDHRSLDIAFAAMSFRSPQNVRIRHQLKGLETDWVESSRDRHVSYSRLPAGNYRFRVIAANDSGVWNQEGASLAITVRPFFWQTLWFEGLALLGAAIAVVLTARHIINRRWRLRMAEVERQATLDRERTRIARDMHDELGASLTQIAITSQLAQLDPPEASPGHIAEVAAIARRAVTSLDEIVWAVNPRNDSLRSLMDYLGQYAVDFLNSAGLECELHLPDEIPARPVSAEYRHHLFLAAKEALNNLVKHSGATKVEVSTKLSAEGVRVEIADNGSGFDPIICREAGNGLRNMQERLAEVQGTCTFESQPGQGTRVILQLPWPQGAK